MSGVWAAVLLGVGAMAGAARGEPAGGLLGQSLAAARSNDLFTFFNLAQTSSRPCGDGQALGFRPTGGTFHSLAAVEVLTDAHGTIAAMTLMLDRAFINDPANGVFARDIAKSFLGDVAGPRAGASFAGLTQEIESGLSSGTTIYRSGAAPPAPSGPPSPGYQAFLGALPSARLSAAGAVLDLANVQQAGKGVLRMSFSAGGASPDCAVAVIPD